MVSGSGASNLNIERTTILLSSHNTSSSVQCFPSQNTNSWQERREEKRTNQANKLINKKNLMTEERRLDLMQWQAPLSPPPLPRASAIFCINYPKAITAALLTTLPRESDCSEQLGLSSFIFICYWYTQPVSLSAQAMLHNVVVVVVVVVGRQRMK